MPRKKFAFKRKGQNHAKKEGEVKEEKLSLIS
jgi:hypothetical protein